MYERQRCDVYSHVCMYVCMYVCVSFRGHKTTVRCLLQCIKYTNWYRCVSTLSSFHVSKYECCEDFIFGIMIIILLCVCAVLLKHIIKYMRSRHNVYYIIYHAFYYTRWWQTNEYIIIIFITTVAAAVYLPIHIHCIRLCINSMKIINNNDLIIQTVTLQKNTLKVAMEACEIRWIYGTCEHIVII